MAEIASATEPCVFYGYSFMLCPSFFLAGKEKWMDYNKDKWKNKEEFFMSMTLLWALICLIIFVVVLAHPKLPNWMTFICMAPVVLLAKVMEAKDIYAVLNNSSLHLMVIICMFSGMIAATGLDIIIGDFVDRVTSSQTGKKKEMMIFAIVYIVSGLISTVLQNSYVAMAFLPVLKSIARKEPDQPF